MHLLLDEMDPKTLDRRVHDRPADQQGRHESDSDPACPGIESGGAAAPGLGAAGAAAKAISVLVLFERTQEPHEQHEEAEGRNHPGETHQRVELAEHESLPVHAEDPERADSQDVDEDRDRYS